jgi:AraC-like DNA-binding protein
MPENIQMYPDRHVPIHPALGDVVADISVQRPDAPSVDDPYMVLPTPYIVLGMQYRGRLHVVRETGAELLGQSGITGLQASARTFQATTETCSILVRLKPGAAFALFGQAASDLSDQHVALASLMFAAPVRALEERLQELSDGDALAATVQRFLLGCMQRAKYAPHPLVLAATARIHAAHGALRIAALARELALSQRHFERLFLAQIGLRPKTYARLVQFDWAMHHAARLPSWTALAHAAGYADQAHFVRSFATFTGTSPERFFAQHPPLF